MKFKNAKSTGAKQSSFTINQRLKYSPVSTTETPLYVYPCDISDFRQGGYRRFGIKF